MSVNGVLAAVLLGHRLDFLFWWKKEIDGVNDLGGKREPANEGV